MLKNTDTSDLFMIDAVFDIDCLYDSFLKVKEVSGWKEPTQRFDENKLFRLYNLRDSVENTVKLFYGEPYKGHIYLPSKPNVFPYTERGKLRLLESYCIEDRIVLSCFAKNVLLPLCRPKLIYDNSASLEGRGTDHFRRRLDYHLKLYMRENGSEGYILLGDYSKFFDNIRHDVFLNTLKTFGADDITVNFAKMFLDSHKYDVSYLSDDEYANCMNTLFNSLDDFKVPAELKNGTKLMAKGVGIGSQIAQIAGVITPYRVDNYCKIVRSVKGYARYMDDFYAIAKEKAFLEDLLQGIIKESEDSGLFINKKKTLIVKLTHGFTILKTKYTLNDYKKSL